MVAILERIICKSMNKRILAVLLVLFSLSAAAQNFTDSNLPIVVIETDGGANIPDEPKIQASMKIIWHQDGSRNYMTDIDNPEYLNYDGRISIERRGSSSQGSFNKKPYVLADAWGNVIDEVHYYDSEPWPTEPDGNGPYLELKNLDSDNSLAENWTFGDDLTKINEFAVNQNIAVHPNPTLGKIHVASSEKAVRCQIISLMGNVLEETSPSTPDFELDLSGLPSGLYLVKIQTVDGQTLFGKVVKQ